MVLMHTQCLYFSKVVLRGKKEQSSYKKNKKQEERMGYDDDNIKLLMKSWNWAISM